MHDSIDLDGYCERIGYGGPRAPTLEVLHALTCAHAQAIPFENVDVLLGRPIRLEPEALYAKLVTARRGGYCFEQNGLLLEVLRRFGFAVRPLSARVRIGLNDRAIKTVRTHLVLEVRIDGEDWITDVGVGSASLTCALRLVADREQPTPHEPRRLVREDGEWYHQILRDGAWHDVYDFTGETMPLVDRTVANWYTSTHPASKFRRDLAVAIARPGGRRVTLRNGDLAFHAADGTARHEDVAAPDRLLAALREHFGIDLPDGTPLRWPAPGAGAQNGA